MPADGSRLFRFHKSVLGRKGGLEFVLALGFRKRIEGNAVFWCVDVTRPNQVSTLQDGYDLLQVKKEELEERYERYLTFFIVLSFTLFLLS